MCKVSQLIDMTRDVGKFHSDVNGRPADGVSAVGERRDCTTAMVHGPALLLATAVTVVGHEGATRTALLSAWTTINRAADPARTGLGTEKVGADSNREERNGAADGQDGSRGEEPPPSPDELAEPNVVTEQSVMREFVARHHERLRFNHDSKSGWYGMSTTGNPIDAS